MKRIKVETKKQILKRIEYRNQRLIFLNKKNNKKINMPQKLITTTSTRFEMRTGIRSKNIVPAPAPISTEPFELISPSKFIYYIENNKNNINKNNIQYINKYDTNELINTSIIISYKESNEERRLNFKEVLKYLSQLLNPQTEIIIVEQDNTSKINWLGEIEKNEQINHIFVINYGIFNKGWGYNIGVKEARGNKLIFHDSDMFLKINSYQEALILLNEFDVIDPYKQLFALDKSNTEIFLANNFDFNIIDNKSYYEYSPISGGIFMMKKDKYLEIKGFDEECFGYGPEDRLFDFKIIRLELKVYNPNDIAIHIHHSKFNKNDEYYSFIERNNNIYEKYLLMTEEELSENLKNIKIMDNNVMDMKKTLNQYFSRIYCINLDSRQDKYNECLIEFKNLNINVERVSAINGRLTFKLGLNQSPGAYGLLLTNIKIIRDAMMNRYKSILILEDDVKFNDNFYRIFNEKILSLPENWDLFYLGGNNLFHKGSFNLITGDPDFNITRENYKTLNYELCKTTWTQTTHAVAINSKFYEKIMEAINLHPTLPIDLQYCMLQQSGYNVYTFLPSLVLQRPSFSDIENQYVDYNNTQCNF